MAEVVSNVQNEPLTGSPKPNLSGGRQPNGSIGRRSRPYRDVTIIKTINKAKFPVYLAGTKGSDQKYALKMFPEEDGQPHTYFKNEIRFTALNHPNIIKNYHVEQGKEISYKGDMITVSYLLMEYAPFGDFFDLVTTYRDHLSDKLIRTYFRQLIEGLEFIHNNGVAHMDLKLDNLLVGNDYNLKIADFDMAHFKDDAIIIGNGTRNYRGPEVIKGKCNNPKAADIFSAGIILFALKTKGGFPHFETKTEGGLQFPELLEENPEQFWGEHSKAQRQDDYFDQEFKELFAMMTRTDPKNRTTIEAIKASKWYNGPHYNLEELKERVERILSYDRYITTIWEPSL